MLARPFLFGSAVLAGDPGKAWALILVVYCYPAVAWDGRRIGPPTQQFCPQNQAVHSLQRVLNSGLL